MEPAAYHQLAENEAHGWYYAARRDAITHLLTNCQASASQPWRILDIGSGTGGTTRELAKFGSVEGVEPSPLARELARRTFPELKMHPIGVQELNSSLPAATYDIITTLGVLYHREAGPLSMAIAGIAHALKSGGLFIWNEATHASLFRDHDRFVHTGQRFEPQAMRSALLNEGFEIIDDRPLLQWAVPIAWVLARLGGKQDTEQQTSTDDQSLPRWLNAALRRLTFFEWRWLGALPFARYGVSRLIVARKIG